LGDDALKVIVPVISAAIESGISIRFGFSPVLFAIASTTGMSIATIAEELMNAPMVPARPQEELINRK